MNTTEARFYMRDIGNQALEAVERHVKGEPATTEERLLLRRLTSEARESLTDAGYPAEAVWRGIQRAGIGVETLSGEPDRFYWENVADDLRAGLETLNSLLSGPIRDIDLHIVG